MRKTDAAANVSRSGHRPLAIACCLVTVCGARAAYGTEGGGTSKALGVDTVMAGAMPPPGLRLTTFLAYYEANKTLDSEGNGRSGLSNFELKVEALTLRFQYVWPGAELWGANVETRLGASVYVKSTVRFDVQTPAGALRRQGSVQGGGDMLFAPALLGWHSERLHQTTGLQLFLPTGSFSPTQLANAGRGYLAIGLVYAATWYPWDSTEFRVSSNYLHNYRNPDTKYRSGRELSVDYGIGHFFSPTVQAGVSGYLYKQVSDDSQNGQTIVGGNRGQAFAIGPFLRYWPNNDWGITFKWQPETGVKNRASGNRVFLQFALKLG